MADPNACVFCQIIAGRLPARTVYEDADHIAFFPLEHINPGHLVLIPKRHTDYLFDLDPAAYQALWATTARIAGPLSAFLAMIHGAEDGDALFFSRDLTVEGDTAAVLALRNAMDDAELDLTEELAGLSGPLAHPLRRVLAGAERATGLHLHRIRDLP